jgi:hypothetical protein
MYKIFALATFFTILTFPIVTRSETESAQSVVYWAAPFGAIAAGMERCKKFNTPSLDAQMEKLTKKYGDKLKGAQIVTRNDGSRTFVAKRHDQTTGEDVHYAYFDSLKTCEDYQTIILAGSGVGDKAKAPADKPQEKPKLEAINTQQKTPVESTTVQHTKSSDLSDPSGLGHRFVAEIEGFLSNRETDGILAVLLVGALADAANYATSINAYKDIVKEVKIIDIQNGQVAWEGRELSAAVVTVEISIINRIAGKYSTVCMKNASIKDDEFGVIRDYFHAYCEDSDSKVSQWKKRNKFPSIVKSVW